MPEAALPSRPLTGIINLNQIHQRQLTTLQALTKPEFVRLKASLDKIKVSQLDLDKAKSKAVSRIDNARKAVRAKRSPQVKAKVAKLEKLIKTRQKSVQKSLQSKIYPPPGKVIAEAVKKSRLAASTLIPATPGLPQTGFPNFERLRKLPKTVPVRLVVYTQPTTIAIFSARLKKLFGISTQKQLGDFGITVETFYKNLLIDRLFVIQFSFVRQINDKTIYGLASAIRKSGGYLSVTPERNHSQLMTPIPLDSRKNYPTNTRWHLQDIQATFAWELPQPNANSRRKGKGVVIGHPDTGWRAHPQYDDDQIDRDRSFHTASGRVGGDAAVHDLRTLFTPMACHGTATASVIVSSHDSGPEKVTNRNPKREEYKRVFAENAVTIWGVAPEAKVIPVKCVDDLTGVIRIGDIHLARAIEYLAGMVTSSGKPLVDVISISLGGMMHPLVETAINEAIRRNIIVVAAAGQGANLPFAADTVIEPAAFQDVIAVAASTERRQPWAESHYGANVDITAPGHGIWVAEFDESNGGAVIEAGSGTSFSTAIVAGAAALWVAHWGKQHLLATYPGIPLAHVFREALRLSADNLPAHRLSGDWDTKCYGAGIINVYRLLKQKLPTKIPTPPLTEANVLIMLAEFGRGLYDLWMMMEDLAQESAEMAEKLYQVSALWIKTAAEEGIAFVRGELEQALAVLESAVGAAREAAQELVDKLGEVVDELVEVAEQAAEQAADTAEQMVDKAGEVVEVIVNAAEDVAEDMATWVGSWWPA